MLRKIRRWQVLVIVLLVIFIAVVLVWPTEVPPEPSALTEEQEVDARGLPDEYESGRASFSISFEEEITNLRLMSVFVLPGEEIALAAPADGPEVTMEAEAGAIDQIDDGQWRWSAPQEQGVYPLNFEHERSGERITLKAFVKVPFDHNADELNGYEIGSYQRKPYRNNPFYTLPDGFIELTPDLLDERVTPHFTLGQFASKQASEFPKYLLLEERLLLKLEMLLALVNESGIDAPTFHVMSGFRTPYYNRLIGNRTKYSVHLYGGAADIFVDVDQDEYMDDIDGDGNVDVEEAQLLASLLEAQTSKESYDRFVGGLGIYAPAPHRGPFIHIDVRGEAARW